MTPRVFRAFWAIHGDPENVEFLEDYRDGTIGGVAFETDAAVEVTQGWFVNAYHTFDGDYRGFRIEDDPDASGRMRAKPAENGPIYVDGIGLLISAR